ncbi:MAG: aldo/keto reductase [Acidobacteria bacterium SCN 69-37]|nr:MAG: aldo/keto reductase [Acidobacteria bacterium SCN 69-37]
MQTRRFGRLGWQVSEVGYGLWGMGGWSGSDDTQSVDSLDYAIEQGCTFFDTALAYGDGKSEQLLGQVLKRHPRHNLTVATKIPPKNGKWPAVSEYRLDDVFPADYIREATETSLKNLGVESIDLQQFHVWTDEWAGDERWQKAVDDLKRQKLIKGFGISINRWEPTNVLRALDTGLVDAVQVVYNIFDQNPEDELFPACREKGIAVIARVPFDEGSLTGTMTHGMTWPQGDWRNLYFSPDKLPAILHRVEALRHDVPAGMSMPELALRFILANPDVSTVIPGMRRKLHVETNLRVSDGRPLASDVLERLRAHRWVRTYFVP